MLKKSWLSHFVDLLRTKFLPQDIFRAKRPKLSENQKNGSKTPGSWRRGVTSINPRPPCASYFFNFLFEIIKPLLMYTIWYVFILKTMLFLSIKSLIRLMRDMFANTLKVKNDSIEIFGLFFSLKYFAEVFDKYKFHSVVRCFKQRICLWWTYNT